VTDELVRVTHDSARVAVHRPFSPHERMFTILPAVAVPFECPDDGSILHKGLGARAGFGFCTRCNTWFPLP
jgi:hypothetical protein